MEKRDTSEFDTDHRQPDAKRVKTDFCSDNSVSLPGILPGSSGPVGFEPGMFRNDDENSRHSRSKSRDKEKSSDGTSKVHKILKKKNIFPTTIADKLLLILNFRKKRKKTRKSINTSTNISIKPMSRIKIKKTKKIKKIRVYLDFWSRMKHERHSVQLKRPVIVIKHFKI